MRLLNLPSDERHWTHLLNGFPARHDLQKSIERHLDGKTFLNQVDRPADNNLSRKARLTQYRKNAGRWQFYAVARNRDGKPNPESTVIDEQRENWQSPGA